MILGKRYFMKIAVITDSGCGISEKEANQAGLFMLPLQITLDNTTLRDCYDITTLDLYERLAEGAMPKTSSPIVQEVGDLMDYLIKEGYDEIISVPLSSGLSGTHQVISLMAIDKNIPITTIEVFTTCNLQRYIALCAKQLVDEGKSAKEIASKLEEIVATNTTLILPNDMQHLKRGGRLTPLAASLASLLKIKPILQINKASQGKIDVLDKVRTEHKAVNSCVDRICEHIADAHCNVYVIHSNCANKAKAIAQEIKDRKPNVNVEIDYISAVIAAHTGLDCIAIQTIEKMK